MLRLRAKVGQKAQVVIPQPVREELGIRPGDEVYFSVEKGKAFLEKESPEEWLRAFRSIVKKKTRFPSDFDWDAEYESQYEERHRRLMRRR